MANITDSKIKHMPYSLQAYLAIRTSNTKKHSVALKKNTISFCAILLVVAQEWYEFVLWNYQCLETYSQLLFNIWSKQMEVLSPFLKSIC